MKMLKIVFFSIFLMISGATSAHAMGDREQGALIGAGAMLLLGNMLGAGQQTHYVEGPVYYESPRTTVVYREPYYTPPRVIYVNPSRHRPSHYYDHRPQYDHGHRHYR